jgi:hypothetical protein
MKVFWSWQSDIPGKIGRHFVRKALSKAIEELKEAPDIEERSEIPPALHIDHDREGVAGSPDLARLILNKIDQSAVFVADVTPVGIVSVAGHSGQPKRLINSNVAIELGYALHVLGDRAILMVLNDHYGGRSDLPFDLQGKAGPIIFTLPPDADARAIAGVESSLKGTLKAALRLCISEYLDATPQPIPPPFRGKAPQDGEGRFRLKGTPLGKSQAIYPFQEDPESVVFMDEGPCFWFRLLPSEDPKREWTFLDLESAAGPERLHLPTIRGYVENRLKAPDGIARCLKLDLPIAVSVSFLFRSGEAWSVDTSLLPEVKGKNYFMLNEARKNLPQLLVSFSQALIGLGLNPPFKWIAGIEEVEGYRLAFDTHQMNEPTYPPLRADRVVTDGSYSPGDNTSSIVDAFSEKVFAECGRKMPEGLI